DLVGMLGHFLLNPEADRVAAGKEDDMGLWMGDKRRSGGFPCALDHLKDSRRRPGLFEVPGDLGPTHRSVFAGLQDDAIPEDEREPGQPERERHRKIPGSDGHDNAARFQDLKATLGRDLVRQYPSILPEVAEGKRVLGSVNRL